MRIVAPVDIIKTRIITEGSGIGVNRKACVSPDVVIPSPTICPKSFIE
jgi:hypothetical protein